MKALKLVYGEECKRIQQAPGTLREVKAAAKERWGAEVHVLSPAGNRMCSEEEYRDALFRNSSLKLVVTGNRPAPYLPVIPQCSLCLRFLSSAEECYTLPCHHLYCFSCIQTRSVQPGQTICSIDKSTGSPSPLPKLQTLLSSLELALDTHDKPTLTSLSTDLFLEINTSLVPCSYLKDGDCVDTSLCKYDHTARAKTIARSIGSQQAVQGKKQEIVAGLPAQEGEKRNSVVEVQIKPLPRQVVELEKVEMMESVYESPPQQAQPAQVLPQHLLSHIQQSLRSSLHSLHSLRVSQLRVFPISCSICGVNPILSCVYQCTHCDLVLCPTCEQRNDHPFPLYKVVKSEQIRGIGKGKAEEMPGNVSMKRPVEQDLEVRLQQMGFKDPSAVRSALRTSSNDIDQAVLQLLNLPETK